MSLLFISHSSKDKAEAEQLLQWLQEQGFDSLFLDSDAQHGIKAGSDWEKTLYREIHRSHAFIFLLSDHWIGSQWCNFEFMQARALGKAIFPLRIQAGLDTTLASEVQHLDLTQDRDDVLQRLHTQLTELSLNTGQHTVWDRSRSPYPGMMAFEAEDAPVFFGREDEIRRLRERLDQHRVQGSAGLLVLLAASGAGKSSLIKAGLLPRLRHDKRHWLVTEALRPEREPLRKFAQLLAAASDQIGDAGRLFEGLQGERALEVLSETLHQLRAQHQQPESTLLLTIDQAEELFTTAKPEQTRQLLELLAAAEAEHLPMLTLLAMRSEYLDTLQASLVQQDSAVTLSHDLLTLNTLPLERVSQLIRGPAEVAGLTVEDGLLSAATQDAATPDALPLLAFALRELYERFGGNGDLTLADYQQLGSEPLNPLENVVQDKAAQALRPEQLSETELKALRDAFIPHMVRVNDSGDYVRQAADWQVLPTAAQPLLDKLTNARLLVKRDGQVEVSHEALLRHWGLLNGWLREEHDFLLGKQQLELSLHDWQQLPEAQRDKGLLRGIALERAREWLFADKAGLSTVEKKYIHLSHIQAEADNQRVELALGEANKLINYINFELRPQLEPLVPLNITKELHERVASYYKNLDSYVDSGEFLRQRAVNLIHQANALLDTGNLSAAEPLYLEASHFMQQRVDSDPSNMDWQHDLSISLEKIGKTLSMKGELNKAKTAFSRSQVIRRTLAANCPEDSELKCDIAAMSSKIGEIFLTQGQLEKAISEFKEGYDIFRLLVNNEPEKIEWKIHLSESLDKISDIYLYRNNLPEAKHKIQESLSIREYLARKNPYNKKLLRNLSTSLGKVGMILSTEGNLNEAKIFFEKALNITQKLAESDKSNAEWQRELSVSLNSLGDTLAKQENLDEAKLLFEKGLKIIEKISMDDPLNLGWRCDLGISHEKIGIIYYLQEKPDRALQHFKIRSGLIKQLVDQEPSNTEWQRDFSISHTKIGDVLLQQGELEEALVFFQKSMIIHKKLITKDPTNFRWQYDAIFTLGKIADVYQDQNNLQNSLEISEKQLKFIENLIEQEPGSIEPQLISFFPLSRLVTLEAVKGNNITAQKHGEKALSILKPLAEQDLLHGQQKQWIGAIENMLEQLNSL